MQVSVWGKYLLGQSDAILKVAGSRAALWTGVVLVLMTACARSYDQTYFFENPFLWLFGPLLFSLVSGSWLYAVVYAGFARREMAASGAPKPAEDGGWVSFMGLFWMTAPIAWLYAIPVERFMDSLSAARANVALLSLVSLWRVLLMAHVLQVTSNAPFMHALIWVLFAASVEVLVVFFFGGAFARALMSGMGGMRNSPEEDIILGAMGTAFTGALWVAPISLVAAMIWRPGALLKPLPKPAKETTRWRVLALAGVAWVAVAVVPQRELANNARVERLLNENRPRDALDVLSNLRPTDFAPAKPLAPKAFETSIFKELPLCFGVVRETDPSWVRDHLFTRLDAMVLGLGPKWRPPLSDASWPRGERIGSTVRGLHRFVRDAEGLGQLIDGLERLPEGRSWMATNDFFLEAIWQTTSSPTLRSGKNAKPESEQLSHWLVLSNRLAPRFSTNSPAK